MSILLLLLKITAFTLLFLLALIIGILLIILLVPVRYDLKLEYKDSLLFNLSISWLLKIIRFDLSYDKELRTGLKIFGIDRSRKENYEEDEEDYEYLDEDFDLEDGEFKDTQKEAVGEEEKVHEEEPKADDTGNKSAEETANEDIKEDITNPKKKGRKKAGKKRQSFIDFIKTKYENIKKEIKELAGKKDRIKKIIKNESFRSGLKKIWQAFVKLLKLFKAKKLSGKVIFGFDDPYTTGTVLSYMALVYFWYGKNVEVTPVFDKEILELDIKAKGGVRLMPIVIICTGLWFDKDFKRVYKVYKNRDKIL